MQRFLAAAVVVLTVAPARAHDRWEYVVFNASDDAISTPNFMLHGERQRLHDLELDAAVDSDWYTVRGEPYHSYEARVNGGIMAWVPECTAPCPSLGLISDAGLVVKTGVVSDDDVGFQSGTNRIGLGLTVRWSAAGVRFLQVTGSDFPGATGPETTYDVSLRDTTYTIPRWNSSGTQVSVLVVQNTTPYQILADAHFFDSAGTLLASHPITLTPRALQVISTASIPALAGRSGSALIAHRGGYGALAGKVVSVEPATGFTFDTPIEPIPY